jgi:hypothetical protein
MWSPLGFIADLLPKIVFLLLTTPTNFNTLLIYTLLTLLSFKLIKIK